jgi:CRISPR-associated protein Cas5t
MLGVRVSVPIACFRKGAAREYLETEEIPPPSTCYGLLLSLVGEVDRGRHRGARVTAALLEQPSRSVVLRTVWRVKNRPLGSGGNTRPDYQQLLTGVELVIWVDSSPEEGEPPTLESRVRTALDPSTRGRIERFGGLSLGESTHLVDAVSQFDSSGGGEARTFLLAEHGRLTLPVWVDHVGSAGTNFVTGELEVLGLGPPDPKRIPRIQPRESQGK